MNATSDRRQRHAETMLRGIRSSGVCVIYHDADLAVRLIENQPASWPEPEAILSVGDAAIFDPYTAERVLAAKREVLASGEAKRIEAPQRRDGADPLWFELSIEPDVHGDGSARGLFVSVTDISRTKCRESALRDLLYQVSHRSRNLLAILQSILGQTAKSATSVAEFEEKFRGRIASLAQSQDLITYANWQGVRFRRLVEAQVGGLAADMAGSVELEGADPILSPQTALHLGLALHELAANSRAFGVLYDGAGRLRVACVPQPGGHRVEWIEEPVHALAPVDAWGFGRTVLQHVVPRAIQAEASFAIAEDGVHYVLDLPEAGEDMGS